MTEMKNVVALFDKARTQGVKRLTLRLDNIVIRPNAADMIEVHYRKSFQGRVVDGSFVRSTYTQPHVIDFLAELNGRPAEVIKETGKETGRCCCCGRKLSDPESVAAGIGPICATSWGL